QVGGKKSHRMLAAPELHANIADRLRETAVSLPLVERAGNSVAAYLLTANENLHARWIDGIDGHVAPAHGRENASPIRISPSPRGFDEHRVRNRPRHQQRLFPAARLFDEQTDHVLHAFTVTDDLLGERLAHFGQ